MSIQVSLRHVTRYRYDRLVTLGPQVVRLRPAPHCRTPILGYNMKVSPEKHFVNIQQDPHGNFLSRLVFMDKVKEFTVDIDLTVDLVVINPFGFFLEDSAENFPIAYDEALEHDLAPCLKTEEPTPLLKRFLAKVDRTPRRTVDFLVAINTLVFDEIDYVIRLEPGVQAPEETLEKGSGSCRDSAWLLVHMLRHLGMAARFASGYLIQLAPDRKNLDGPSGPEKDFTDLHAWCEVFLPGAGWVGLDPTSGLFAGEGHIPLACSPEPGAAAPISGGVEECETEFEVTMEVIRLPEAPRSTRPYDEETWKRIDKLGQEVDLRLDEADVRLTMGGEPTFVSIDDFDGAEWNTEALGPNKRRLAHELLLKLQKRFAPGAVLHHGQGKQYPGESLPRWAFQCLWRPDGEPVWTDPELFAREDSPKKATPDDASLFLSHLADRLGVDPKYAMPGHEDVWYWMWKERRLPINVDPHKSNLKDVEERERIARVFDRGLQDVVGYALPLRFSDNGWETGNWFLRRERLYLYPGDSPMGFRLPLDSLPWAPPGDLPLDTPPDPFAPREKLPPRRQGQDEEAIRRSRPVKDFVPAHLVRTALCVEVRDGMVHVFLPPLTKIEQYLDLVGSIEDAARDTSIPVRLEGYPPPRDHRVASFAITPDPGVIEVNIHPSSTWTELKDKTNILYEEARATRLGTEKFLIDGRLAGTGGGNHITLGGSTPNDSPFLRRPDLLKSLVGYWVSHPSLSYVFSGMFIGPTSQAPRLDEARSDAVHELALAFQQMPDKSQTVPPWIVDRVMRNILVDSTGNTHRSEFCVDKLFSPDSSTGRLGLLELRAFEMPPHERMSLVQQLLIRSMVARFWEKPYKAPPPRWNNILHDRWMLPHFLQEDLADVCQDLTDAGMPFDPSWFRPHVEFRFPKEGSFAYQGTEVEIRQALEPWHVLAEEATSFGAARYVDSSVERLQVKVSNAQPGRHSVLCNGARIPFAPTGTEGEFVAGVRYKAWAPPSALHPTIGIHSPLVFDLYDEWAGKAIKGVTYHVMHPGGRGYEDLPVNGNTAEARRHERFQPWGHTPGPFVPRQAPIQPEAPMTLDLRWLAP